MHKSLFFILAIIFISISCGSCKQKSGRNQGGTSNEVKIVTINNKSVDCYSETLKWRITDSTYFDTLVYFRNYDENDSTLRVSCVLNDVDTACESLIYNDKDIRWMCKGYKRLKWYLLMSYKKHHGEIILSLYRTDIKTSETFEFHRYQIFNNQIIGINILPTITDGFRPYDEFKKFKPFEM